MKFKFFTLALTFLTLSVISEAQVLRDHIILNMPFNGNTNDYSGYENHSVIEEADIFHDRFATHGSTYYFDGVDDYIYIPHDNSYKTELPITVSMWVYAENTTSPDNKLFSSDDAADFYSGIFIQLDPSGSGVVTCSYGSGGASGSQNRRTVIGTTPILSDTWTHIACVIYGSEQMKIFINGVEDQVLYEGTGGNIYYTDNPARIGAFDGSSTSDMRFFNGAVDDLKMWDVALTEEEILTVYNELVWDMPVNGDAIDFTENLIDGQMINTGFAKDRFDNPESALLFSGDSSLVVLPHHPLFKPQIPFTVSLWVSAVDADDPDNVLFTNDDHADFYSGINLRYTLDGSISMTYGSGGNSGEANRRTAVSQTPLEDGHWYHVVGICRGAQDMDIYINGVKDSVTYSGSGGDLYYTNMPGKIGGYDGNSTTDTLRFFKGLMDDFRMWNRAISEQEVLDLYTPGNITDIEHVGRNNARPVLIYPNPAANILNIESLENVSFEKYEIYNMNGQLLQSGKLDSSTIPIGQLNTGIHILKVQTTKSSLVQHFLKM